MKSEVDGGALKMLKLSLHSEGMIGLALMAWGGGGWGRTTELFRGWVWCNFPSRDLSDEFVAGDVEVGG